MPEDTIPVRLPRALVERLDAMRVPVLRTRDREGMQRRSEVLDEALDALELVRRIEQERAGR